MPELPEVETVCRGIRPHVIGRTILGIQWSGKSLRTPVQIERLRSLLTGRTFTSVNRRAKYILASMDDGTMLVIHLGMTGNLGLFSRDLAPSKHCHLRFLLSDTMELRYCDARRFGSIQTLNAEEAGQIESALFAATGPEPFSDAFSADYLTCMAKNRSIAVKPFIMTNQVVAGVGNIYANESLFRAGIAPTRSASTISKREWQALVIAIRQVLDEAIACGGSTISDYVNAEQERGYFQMNFAVYGRMGEGCLNCGKEIYKQQIGGRASFWCLNCQS